jgi:hypothetical protein
VVALASDKRLDLTIQHLQEKPQFFSSRPVLFSTGDTPATEYLRARWWPGEDPGEPDDSSEK